MGAVDVPHLQACLRSGSHTLVAWSPLPYYSPAIGFQGKRTSFFLKTGPSHILSTIRFQAWSLEAETHGCIPEPEKLRSNHQGSISGQPFLRDWDPFKMAQP